MATPNSRNTLKEYCKRRLGHPVIEINIDDDQMDDRIDDALAYYRDYHYDAVEKVFLKPVFAKPSVSAILDEEETARIKLTEDQARLL